VPASQKWLERRTQLAAEHAAAGQFSSAMSLLFRQLGVVAFEPLKPHMLELYTASHAVLPGLQVGIWWVGQYDNYRVSAKQAVRP
jgi:coatomer protein complex subunit alpha (xenin)